MCRLFGNISVENNTKINEDVYSCGTNSRRRCAERTYGRPSHTKVVIERQHHHRHQCARVRVCIHQYVADTECFVWHLPVVCVSVAMTVAEFRDHFSHVFYSSARCITLAVRTPWRAVATHRTITNQTNNTQQVLLHAHTLTHSRTRTLCFLCVWFVLFRVPVAGVPWVRMAIWLRCVPPRGCTVSDGRRTDAREESPHTHTHTHASNVCSPAAAEKWAKPNAVIPPTWKSLNTTRQDTTQNTRTKRMFWLLSSAASVANRAFGQLPIAIEAQVTIFLI